MTASCLTLALSLLAAGPEDTMVVQMPELVVTGSRVPESVLHLPSAISVVGAKDFDATRQLGIRDALSMVPGVFAQSRSGAPDVRITIRGYGARGNGERSNVGNMRGIRMMSDGVPITEPDGRTSLDLVDLASVDRIEVARSNSSTLYGNASGGVVHLRTDFGFPSPYLEYRQRAGSFGYHREQGGTGFTIGSGRGVFTLLNTTYDGWREHSTSNAVLAQARMQFPLDPATKLGVSLDGTHTLNRFPGALTAEDLAANPQLADSDYVARDERRDHTVGRVALSLDRSMGETQDLRLAAWVEPKVLHRSERNRFRDFTRYHVGGSAMYDTRWTLGETKAATLLGADEAYQDGAILFYDLVDGSRGENLIANKREAANSAGIFAQQGFDLGPWSLRVSGRWDIVRYVSEDFIDPTLDATKDFKHFTPKASVAYSFDRHTLYAALGGGLEAPAFNEIDPPAPYDTLTSLNPFLEPMLSTTYELGAKGKLVTSSVWGSLDYDAALYWIDVRNEIVPFGGGAYFVSAGKSHRQGFETGLDWRPIQALSWRAAAAFTNAEYDEYSNDLGDFSGNQVPGLPDINLSTAVRYGFGGGLWAEAQVEHVGDYFADDRNSAQADAYTIFGGSLGLERTLGTMAARVFVSGQNLGDEDYVASVFINGINDEYYEPGLPASWSAGLTLRWR